VSSFQTKEYEIVAAGSVWKILYHGAWVATANDRADAEGYVKANQAGLPYTIRPARHAA
jgi:hypothetical protein